MGQLGGGKNNEPFTLRVEAISADDKKYYIYFKALCWERQFLCTTKYLGKHLFLSNNL